MTTYVLGFLFSSDLSRVVLILKTKPARQVGRWNGVGGKLEAGETAMEAMIREFREETGKETSEENWTPFGKLRGEGWAIFLFAGRGDVSTVKTTTAEKVRVFRTRNILDDGPAIVAPDAAGPLLGNIRWLVQMSLAVLRGEESCRFFEIEERA